MNTENQKTWVRNRDQTWIGNRKQKLENRDWKQRYNQKTGLGTENKGLKTGTAAFFERNHACGCQEVFLI